MLRALRRVKQLGYLLSSPTFIGHETVQNRMCERYDDDAEVQHYLRIAEDGLFGEEEAIVQRYLQSSTRPTDLHSIQVLVVGCGAGREAFALARLGMQVTGIDVSSKMVKTAKAAAVRQKIDVRFECCSLESYRGEKADFVFVSTAIAEHIQGRARRIEFYSRAKKFLKSSGLMYVSPSIMPLRITDSRFWAAQLIRLRWLGSSWEPGDSARAFFGTHNRDYRPVFFHYYPTEADFVGELQAAELAPLCSEYGAYLVKEKASV